jgi:lysozyme family protein
MNIPNTLTAVVQGILAEEQGYVNNPDDRGGPTKYGITQDEANRHKAELTRQFGWDGDMKNLTVAMASYVYMQTYIQAPGFDKVFAESKAVGYAVIDYGVNSGEMIAGKTLQNWLNGLNYNDLYPDLVVDGNVGAVTISALKTYLQYRGAKGERVLFEGINASRGANFLAITQNDKSQREFLFGWVLNRVMQWS